MKLKAIYQNSNEIPEGAAPFYEERDGSWHLSVEGMVHKAKLEEFRTNNIELARERDDLRQKLEGIDLDEYRDLKSRADDIKAEKLLKKGDVDALIAERTGEMKREHEKALKKLQQTADEATASLSRVMIDQALVAAGSKHHVRPEAIEDLAARGRGVFRLEDGAPRAYGQDGKPIYDGNAEPLTIDQYVEQLARKAPHLFEPSTGTGGALGNGTAGTSPTGRNPWKKETWNLTEQGKIIKQDPAMAKRLRATAGAA